MSSDVFEGITRIAEGAAKNEAAKAEARDEKKQAALELLEAQKEEERVREQNRKFLAKQKLQYIKAGVTLEDTPLLVLEDTLEKSKKEEADILAAGGARAAFRRNRAKRIKKGGRTALVTGILSGAASFARAQEKNEEKAKKGKK